MASRRSRRQTEPPATGSEHPPLDGGDDEDADTGNDTTAPDDDNDVIASFTSKQTTAIQDLKLVTVARAPSEGCRLSLCTGTRWSSRPRLDLERVVYEQRTLAQPPLTAPTGDEQAKGVQSLLSLTVTYAVPAHISEFPDHRLDAYLSSSTTPLPWPQLSTSASSCISRRNKGTLTAYLTYLQPSQRFL